MSTLDSDLRDEIDALARLLQRLKVVDSSLRVFGASSHLYLLGAVLSEAEISSFEDRIGVRLPDDFRLFLARVGNGGAGPFYGLLPLESSAEEMDPGRVFPWTKAVFVDEGAAAQMKLSAVDIEPLQTDRSEIKSSMPGALRLAEEGCAYYQFLVVNGPAYGTVWSDWMPADCGLVPSKLTFAAWYRQWIERCLSRLARAPFVDNLKTGMSRMKVIDLLGENFIEKSTPARWQSGETTTISYGDAAVTLFMNGEIVARIVRHNI